MSRRALSVASHHSRTLHLLQPPACVIVRLLKEVFRTSVQRTACCAVLSLASGLGLSAGLQPCTKGGFAQIQNFTGRWVDSPKEDFNGFYTMLTDCPAWVREYDCKNPSLTGVHLLIWVIEVIQASWFGLRS